MINFLKIAFLISLFIVSKAFINKSIGKAVKYNFLNDLMPYKNINKDMVLKGYAVAYDRYTKDYVSAQKDAKKHKRGIWSGRFMKPELYRRLVH